jgi:transposase
MEIELLGKLLGLSNYSVKNYTIREKEIIIDIARDGFPVCPKCGLKVTEAPKDRRKQKIEDLSVFGKRCFLRMEKFRVDCSCGYSGTENIEWLNRYERITIRLQDWLYAFCKRMTCKDTSIVFGVSKHLVYRLDKESIERELREQKPLNPKRIGIDEVSHKKGHRYATIISAPGERKILEVVKGRKSVDLAPFFKGKGTKWCKRIESVSMDAWLAFRKTIKKYCKNAAISFDHFHLTQHFSKAIDSLRIQESRNDRKKNRGIYRGTRWLLLCNPDKLGEEQNNSLQRLLKINRKLFTMYLLRERFRDIFKGLTPHSRLIRFSIWLNESKRAKIGPLSGFVNKVIRWEPYIRNSLRGNYSNAFSEGLNNKIRVIQRMAYGYKDFEYLRLKIFQQFNFRNVGSIFD